MEDDTQREIRTHDKTDHYKQSQLQIMALIAERDNAYQETNIALAEKKAAIAERDMAFLQRDSALFDRNSALLQRNSALQQTHHFNFTFSPNSPPKPKQGKKQTKKLTIAKKSTRIRNEEWKEQDLGLNEVVFDESTMPVPVCSCTGRYHQCYKWGEGGWQSSCCTLSMSVHPLPVMENKKHARMSGRKMSGNVFRRLLSRLAAEGFDLSLPVDLKDHWSRHGTNRYITIK